MIEQPKHDARLRENPDPHEKGHPVPLPVLGVVALVLAWGVYYILTTQRDDDPALGDRRTLSTLEAKPAGAAGSVDGAQIYAANCVACHQATGLGLPGVFPPLAGSEWVTGQDKVLVNIVLHGVTGKLTVKGTPYAGAMPTFKDKLNDAEIAAVLTHLRSNFGNAAAKIGADAVKAERESGKARTEPWNGDDDLAKLKQ
jgi:mono/diheme cytochrome c family protein